jgi:hypothetical protein
MTGLGALVSALHPRASVQILRGTEEAKRLHAAIIGPT